MLPSKLAGALAILCLPALIASCRRGSPSPPATSRTARVTYRATLPATAGPRKAELWLPLPAQNELQQVSGIELKTNGMLEVRTDAQYSNRFVYVEQNPAWGEAFELELSCSVTRRSCDAPRALLTERGALLQRFLMPDALVPIDGPIAAEARTLINPGMDPLAKVRAIYEHVTRTMRYDKTVPGYGRGDAVRVCELRRGNCTDIHSAFIGMCRASGLPARLVMGFPLPADEPVAEVGGYHCWAEVHLAGRGWFPVDLAEAIKHPEKHEFYFGSLDADRLEFTIGRDIILEPDAPGNPQNYFIYPVAALDDRPADGVRWQLRIEPERRGATADAAPRQAVAAPAPERASRS